MVLFLYTIIFFFIKCTVLYSCQINKIIHINTPLQINTPLRQIHTIIDYKKIYNIFNTFSIIEESVSNKNSKNILYTFAIFDEKFKYSNDGVYQLLELSSKYNSNFCIIHNQCNLYDNFRLKIDYTLLYMEKMYNCTIDTNRTLDRNYIIYGKFPYYCSLYQNGKYEKIKIIQM